MSSVSTDEHVKIVVYFSEGSEDGGIEVSQEQLEMLQLSHVAVRKIEYYDENNYLHRVGGPAIIYNSRLPAPEVTWCHHGKRHRLDGPATIFNHCSRWYVDGELHRDGGPAVQYTDGSEMWYREGQLHRVDGPAYKCSDGTSYWLNGEKVSKKRHQKLVKEKQW